MITMNRLKWQAFLGFIDREHHIEFAQGLAT